MYQESYYNYGGNFGDFQNLASYPGGTLLGGNESLTRPRPMYNVRPEHNLPSYSLNMNSRTYDNGVNNNYKKFNRVVGDILKNREKNNINDIIIIIL